MASEASSIPLIPHIHLLALQPSASEALKEALNHYNFTDQISYTIHNTALSQLSHDITFDLIVSPANSYGILDGGFDDAISRAWSPKNNYIALTRHVQAELYQACLGFLPPGNCHIIRIPDEWKGALRYEKDGWGAKYLALCPTMRVPSDCRWDREVVYECIWALLNAIKKHNDSLPKVSAEAHTSGDSATGSIGDAASPIKSILMTPLGTATGKASDERWAKQCVLAMKHYLEAVGESEKWQKLNWPEAGRLSLEVKRTHGL